MKYHKIPESSIQAELELDWDFQEHSRTYQLFGIIWNNFSQGHLNPLLHRLFLDHDIIFYF